MTERLIKRLNSRTDVDGWLINQAATTAHEFFFIQDKLDLNRTKDVTKTKLTVYKSFKADGEDFLGSASTVLAPVTTDDELGAIIDELLLGASFVKNTPYQLAPPLKTAPAPVPCNAADKPPIKLAGDIVKALYSGDDKTDNGGINSVELFLQHTVHRTINSRGLDHAQTTHYGEIELVVDWQEGDLEAVELFDVLRFSDVDEDKMKAFAKDALDVVRMRAKAVPIGKVTNVPVILTRQSVPEFFNIFTQKANAQMVYEKYSDAKLNDKLQGDSISGDAVNLKLVPVLTGSPANRSVDSDGIALQAQTLYQDGTLKTYGADNRFSQYLHVPATGHMGNVSVAGGKQSLAQLKAAPHLELITFSDFQMNDITGDFGGEIRLGRYFDGKKTTLITGGSISGNFKQAGGTMQLASETEQQGSFFGPVAIKLNGVTIAY